MDKDSKLIFEKYSKVNIEIIEESYKLLLFLATPLMAYVSGKTGITDYVLKVFKKAFGIDLEVFLNIPGVSLIKYLEPYGLTNWPDVNKYQELYDAEPTDENLWKLFEAMFYTYPIIGKYSKGIKGLAKGSKELGILSRIGVTVVRKAIGVALQTPRIKYKLIKSLLGSKSKIYINIVSSILGVSLTRMLGIRFLATGAVMLTDDGKKFIEDYTGQTPFSDESQGTVQTAPRSTKDPVDIQSKIEEINF